MDPEQRNHIYSQEASQLPDEALIAILQYTYRRDEPPPCRVCAGKLSIVSAGGGNATVWACVGTEADPDNPGRMRRAEGRLPADQHYSDSRWTQLRSGDEHVLELIGRYLKKLSSAQ